MMSEADFLALRRVARVYTALWIVLVIATALLVKTFGWWPIPAVIFAMAFFPGTTATRIAAASYQEYQEMAPMLVEAEPMQVGSLKGLVASWSWLTKGLIVVLFGLGALFGALLLSGGFHWIALGFTAACSLIGGYVAFRWIQGGFARLARPPNSEN